MSVKVFIFIVVCCICAFLNCFNWTKTKGIEWIESRKKYCLPLILVVVISSFFLSFPKETFLDEDETYDTFKDIAALRTTLYTYEPLPNEDTHEFEYSSTGMPITILLLSNAEYGPSQNASDPMILYIHDGKMYKSFKPVGEVDGKIPYDFVDEVSLDTALLDHDVAFNTYYTVNCYFYGRLCTSGSTEDDGKKKKL